MEGRERRKGSESRKIPLSQQQAGKDKKGCALFRKSMHRFTKKNVPF